MGYNMNPKAWVAAALSVVLMLGAALILTSISDSSASSGMEQRMSMTYDMPILQIEEVDVNRNGIRDTIEYPSAYDGSIISGYPIETIMSSMRQGTYGEYNFRVKP